MNPPQPARLPGPHNLQAEQALLGAVLFDNRAVERCDDAADLARRPRLDACHFAEPLHAQMYAEVLALLAHGRVADPVTLGARLAEAPAYLDLGGPAYLFDLIDKAPPACNAPDYAHLVRESALRRDLHRTAVEFAARAETDLELDACELLAEAEGALHAIATATAAAAQGFTDFAVVLDGAMVQAEAAHGRDGALVGLSTGLADLDSKLGGLHPSDLLVLAGRPSQGKTALATNIAYRAARNGASVGFFSLEMSGEQLAMRILADVSGVPGDRIRKGLTDACEIARIREAAAHIRATPLHVDPTGAISIAELSRKARRLKRRRGLDLLVVDYLQLCTAHTAKGSGRVQEVAAITTGLKALAKELAVPVLALSQLSRAVESREDKRPHLADLRESGSIEQDADVVMFVYREGYYLARAEPREGAPEHLDWQARMEAAAGLAEIIVGKHRHGPIGAVRLRFDEALTRFGDWG